MPGVAALPSSLDAPSVLVQNKVKNYESTQTLSSFSHSTSSSINTTTSPTLSSADSAIMSHNQPASNSIIDILEHVIEDDEDDEFDYEALPENTSLHINMLAGAAAGIMVRYKLLLKYLTIHQLTTLGTLGHVSCRCHQGE